MEIKDLHLHSSDEPRVALVTGGTGALGSAVVELLARNGWSVVFQYASDKAGAAALETKIAELGASVASFKCNFEDAKDQTLSDSLDQAVQKLGPVDTFVHCASPPVVSTGFDSQGAAEFLQTAQVTVGSFLRILETCLPEMKYRQNGDVVGILSEALLPPGVPDWSAYSAAKAAFAQCLEDLARDVGSVGVRVSGLLPGAFTDTGRRSPWGDTDNWPKTSPEAVAGSVLELIEGQHPLRRCRFVAINGRDGVRDVGSLGFSLQSRDEAAEPASGATTPESVSPVPQVNGHISQQLQPVFRRVFDLNEDEPVENAELGIWTRWDSLKHLELLMAVEQEFEIDFSESEVASLTNFEQILEALERRR